MDSEAGDADHLPCGRAIIDWWLMTKDKVDDAPPRTAFQRRKCGCSMPRSYYREAKERILPVNLKPWQFFLNSDLQPLRTDNSRRCTFLFI